MRKFWKGINGYFIHIMISFLLLVLLPVVCMGLVWYGRAQKQEEEYRTERELEKMHAVSLEFERRIAAVETDLAVFQYSKAFRKYAASSNRTIYEIKDDIQSLMKKNEVLTSLYLYDTASHTIYNSASGSYDISEFYDTEWMDQIENSLQFKRLPVRSSLDRELGKKVHGTGLERIYPYRSYLSILAQKTFGIYLMANIDIKNLGEYVQKIYPLDLKQGEKAYVVSGEGQIYYANEYEVPDISLEMNPEKWEEQERMVWEEGDRICFARKLAYEDLYYVETYDRSAFFESGSGHGAYIAGICFLLSLFLIVLAYMVSRRLYQPVKGLYAEIKKTSVLSDESMHEDLEALQRAFVEMSRHYESAVAEEKSYQEFMKMSYLRMMLNGIFSQKKFFEENSSIYLKEGTKGYQLLICRLVSMEDMAAEDFENFSFRLKSVINSYLQAVSIGIFTEVEDTGFAAFYAISDEETAAYFQRFLMKAVNQMAGSGNYFASSPVISAEEEVREWYRRCGKTICDAMFFESSRDEILCVQERRNGGGTADSMVNYERSLIRAMVNGDPSALREELQKLGEELKREQTAEDAMNGCCHIMVTLDKEFKFYKLMEVDVQKECRSQTTMRSLLAYMEDRLNQAVKLLNQDSSLENRYCREAKFYLEQNYMRDLNVTEVADALGISYAYLSKIFKSQPEGSGKLSEYLNIIRINRSKEYLKDTAMNLNEIAEKVGYNNVQSFQRFFKKYENMTPGEYRKYLLTVSE